MSWTPKPYVRCEMAVSIAGERHWITVEPMSYPVTHRAMGNVSVNLVQRHPTTCPRVGSSYYLTHPEAQMILVRTFPGKGWSAVWVPLDLLREPVLEDAPA